MTARRDEDLDELRTQGEELIDLGRRAAREGWSIDELEQALLERMTALHEACMDWVKKNQCSKDLDRKSDDDQSAGRGIP